MPTSTPRLLAGGFALPEGPRWRDGRLWFSDVYGRRIHRMDESGSLELVTDFSQPSELNSRPSGLGFLPDGDLLVVDNYHQRLAQLHRGDVVASTDLNSAANGVCNDMGFDRSGRAYVGDMGHTAETMIERAATDPVGQVLMVEPGQPARVVASGLFAPNGIAVAPDGQTLAVVECYGPMRISGFPIAADGTLGERRTLVNFGEGAPDGMCYDAEGAIWVALHPRAGRPATIDPDAVPRPVDTTGCEFLRIIDGEIVDRITYTDRWPIACALGGADGRTLFMTTVEAPTEGHFAFDNGFVEAIEIDVPGPGF